MIYWWLLISPCWVFLPYLRFASRQAVANEKLPHSRVSSLSLIHILVMDASATDAQIGCKDVSTTYDEIMDRMDADTTVSAELKPVSYTHLDVYKRQLFMLRAKSKKFRLLGKATLVPSIFNINEPLQYGAVVGNPFMLIPTVLIAIILPGFSYLWFAMGWGTINYVNFDMNFAPNAVSAFFMSGGDWRNVLLICINFVLAALIWYPFFKAADKAECKKEAEREAAKAAVKA